MNNQRFLLWVLLVLVLSGCGGDANTGSNGTGILPVPTEPTVASGPLTSLGPLGIAASQLTDTGTSVQVDFDSQRPATDLRLGMPVDAAGLVSLSTNTGVASSAVAQSLVLGPATSVDAARSSLRVMGVSVRADSNTLLDGVASLAEIPLGDQVEVFGLQLPTNQGIHATRLVVRRGAPNAPVEAIAIYPDFSPPAAFLTVDGLQLNLTGVGFSTLRAGLIRVRGTYDAASNSLIATTVASPSVPSRAEAAVVYVDGFVLVQTAPSRFQVGDVYVDTLAVGATLSVGTRVSVRGRMRGGILEVDQLAVIASGQRIEYRVEGPITAMASVADFTVRGERIDASQAVFSNGSAASLVPGQRVRVRGTAGPGKLTAVEVTIE